MVILGRWVFLMSEVFLSYKTKSAPRAISLSPSPPSFLPPSPSLSCSLSPTSSLPPAHSRYLPLPPSLPLVLSLLLALAFRQKSLKPFKVLHLRSEAVRQNLHYKTQSVRWQGGLTRSATPQDPAVGLCLGHYGGPRRGTVSHERGTGVHRS